MVDYGKSREGTRDEAYAEAEGFRHNGDLYKVRVTALYPYKDYKRGGDRLYCHLDYKNVTKNTVGRFANVWVDERDPNERDGHLRRHSTYRTLARLLDQQTPDDSPVFKKERLTTR